MWVALAMGCGTEPTVLEGTYRRVDARMRPTPPAVYAGHAAVELDDGRRVWLEAPWSPEAIRSPTEQALEGHRVRVTGVLHARPPEAPDPVAMPLVPCLAPVLEVAPIP